ncbi:uracil-DNA glycosylase [Nonomuraea sp. NPDC050310]|uniref:uracil-DNA glycosylase n=1 Tax=Nonomuraea sp. NPDC050310 TaxID=3154935 RepID=UPI0033D01304
MSFVPPGSGWPDDPATPETPVAHDPAEVAELAGACRTLGELTARQSVCRACPRLVAWREEVATVKRRAFAEETYWGRPIAGWGSEEPRLLIVGLAPAAHGGNRTGRIFTGDRSGDWLFASLHRTGWAAQETSTYAGDGQELLGARMLASVRCAPPANKPLPEERAACFPWLVREVELVAGSTRVIVALGGFAWQALWPALREAGYALPKARPPFGHGEEVDLRYGEAAVKLIGCYHPSQQNTFTGRVTAPMLDQIFRRAAEV